MNRAIDLEEVGKIAGWAIFPAEADTVSPIAFFVVKEHADALLALLRSGASGHFDLVIVPALLGSVVCANTLDYEAGVAALARVHDVSRRLFNLEGCEVMP